MVSSGLLETVHEQYPLLDDSQQIQTLQVEAFETQTSLLGSHTIKIEVFMVNYADLALDQFKISLQILTVKTNQLPFFKKPCLKQ